MAKSANKGLGRGYASLLGLNVDDLEKSGLIEGATNSSDGVVMLSLLDIDPNREQPRKNFDQDALNELAESIKRLPIGVTIIGCTTP